MSDNLGNEKQAEYWNGTAGSKWVERQEALDAQIGPLGLVMLDRAEIQEGERILDTGCGCGGTTVDIAGRAGPSGHVTGVDLSGPMLERARERARESDLENVDFIQGDAQTHDFGSLECDLLTSRFGIMFFADPTAAFANLRQVLKPRGRLAFVCWRPLEENPWSAVPTAAAAKIIEMPPPPGPEDPGPYSLADPDRVRRILKDAGFSSIAIEAEDQIFLPEEGGLDGAVASRFEIGPLSRLLVDATAEQKEQVRNAVREAMAPYYTEGGPEMNWAVWIVTARAS